MRASTVLPTVKLSYKALCLSCGGLSTVEPTEQGRQEWVDAHRGHRVMVGDVPVPEEPELPAPLVTCPHAEVGDPSSPRWRLMAAYVSRTRAARVEHANWCLDHAGYYTDEQFQVVMGIISGDGDPILQKELEHGYEPA